MLHEVASPQFVDVTDASGLAVRTRFEGLGRDPHEIAVIGVAAGDYDRDGDVDLFIVRGDLEPNLLYQNRGGLVFEDVAERAGVAFTKTATQNYLHSAPTFADMDGDHDLDLFIGSLEGDPARIFANNGSGRFSDVTAGSGIDAMQAPQTMSSAFGDYDLDGDLDLFVAHWGTPRNAEVPGDTEHLWRNDSTPGLIRFSSVSVEAGISPTILTLEDPNVVRPRGLDYTFTPTFARIDEDLFPDIVVAADFNSSQVFLNTGGGAFTNATDPGVIIDGNGMGSAVGDYDNDGDLDWFVSSIAANPDVPFNGIHSTLGNRLYRNTEGVFEDVTEEAGVADGGWGWGACFVDLENDGDLDLYHTNGFPHVGVEGDFREDRSRAFVSDGAGTFHDQAEELGLADREMGRGVVCADFDNDGDTDILQLHRRKEQSVTLWENRTAENNFLKVKLYGAAPNTEAAGARIEVLSNGNRQMREIMIGSNFVSQNPTMQVFGLGSATGVDEVRVQWPSGTTTELLNVRANQTLCLQHPR